MACGNNSKGTVYVVDDDQPILDMMTELLQTIDVMVRTFNSGKEFLEAYQPASCECLVCDIRMPDIDGIELHKRMIAMPISPPMIFLTGFAELQIAVDAMKRGAFEFLMKPIIPQEFLNKIQLALDSSRGPYLRWLDRQAKEARLALLTHRERSVIRLVIDAKSSREISESLGLSARTVEKHRTRIMEKLHVESTVDMVKLFL